MPAGRGHMGEPPYRWVIVASVAAMLAIAMGQLVNGLSVFFIPLEQEFGWPRGAIALINSAGLVGLALGGVIMGMVADRAPIRAVCLASALAVGFCVVLAAGADRLSQFYLLFFLAALRPAHRPRRQLVPHRRRPRHRHRLGWPSGRSGRRALRNRFPD